MYKITVFGHHDEPTPRNFYIHSNYIIHILCGDDDGLYMRLLVYGYGGVIDWWCEHYFYFIFFIMLNKLTLCFIDTFFTSKKILRASFFLFFSQHLIEFS